MTKVVNEIAAERRRQIEQEGWTTEHDDQHTDGSLADAAAVYLGAEVPWPASWSLEWYKPKNYRRDLIRAGALIVAEIERLDRAGGEP
jgi:hypothetical protein